jgi:hypothetical protein
MGGGMRGMAGGGMGGGLHGMAGSPHFAAIGPGPRVGSVAGDPHFAGSSHFSHFAFHDRDGFHHNHFFHHRRFAFFDDGGGYYYDYGYNGCYRRVWTAYGLQWVNVCGDSGYYGSY